MLDYIAAVATTALYRSAQLLIADPTPTPRPGGEIKERCELVKAFDPVAEWGVGNFLGLVNKYKWYIVAIALGMLILTAFAHNQNKKWLVITGRVVGLILLFGVVYSMIATGATPGGKSTC